MLNLVLFGAPGSGKGTQADRLVDQYHLVHISTGDILRQEIASGTPLGAQVAARIDKGELVPDEMVIAMLSARIDEHSGARGFIFDGFPRTVAQAEALDHLLKERNMSVRALIALDVSKEELVQRLQLRGKISGRPDDQSTDIIEHRIKVYHHKTEPVIQFYSKQGKYYPVAGLGSVDEVFSRISEAIRKVYPNRKI